MKQRRSKSDDPADLDLSNGPVRTPDAIPDEPIPPESTRDAAPLPDVPTLSATPAETPLRESIAPEDPVAPALTLTGPVAADLEQRVRRLEEALALLQRSGSVPPSHVTEERPHTLPVASPVTPGSPGGSRPVAATGQRNSGWLLWEMLVELRVFLRMYTDPRYQMSWYGRTIPLVLLLIFVFSSFAIPLASVPVVGWLFQKLGELIVAYILVKSLGYEARRYRQKAPDLPASLRL